MNSNNPLAVKPETENDAGAENSSASCFLDSPRLQRRLARQRQGFPKMINTLKHRALLVTAIFMVATPAWSQAPTDAQRNAIRSQCRADYQAHCASVPPGGAASLQCLQKNMSSLSPGCAGAVRAVEPAAAPKAEFGAGSGAQGRADAGSRAQERCRTRTGGSRRHSGCGSCEAGNRGTGSGPEGCSGRHGGKAADRCAGGRDPQRLPLRLSESLRRRADRRRSGAAMPGEEQGEGVGALRAGRQRGQWRYRARSGRRRGDREPGSGPGGCIARAGIGAATDATARGIVRPEVGMQRRRSHAVRRCRTGRRPHHAMSGDTSGLGFARMQGSAGPVRGELNCNTANWEEAPCVSP